MCLPRGRRDLVPVGGPELAMNRTTEEAEAGQTRARANNDHLGLAVEGGSPPLRAWGRHVGKPHPKASLRDMSSGGRTPMQELGTNRGLATVRVPPSSLTTSAGPMGSFDYCCVDYSSRYLGKAA